MVSFRLALCAAFITGAPLLAQAKMLSDIERLRQQAQADCYDDVNKLCPDEIPDEDKIKVCMKAKRAQLSPACRKDFEQGLVLEDK